MQTAHTPGPWRVSPKGAYVMTHEKKNTAFVMEANRSANASLIAAAPELLDALQTMLAAVDADRIPGIGLATDKARAAIAKAEGSAQ